MEYIVNSNDLTSVANAIRTKGETSAPLAFPNGFVSAIEDIPTGGGGAEVQPLNVLKNGTYTAPEGTAYSPVVVNVLPSHKAGNVRFIDYDGTLLYSFSKDDIDEMESLPTNPVHDGLIAQGWNWSLADIKSYLTDYPDAVVNVGQMYTTDDGKTRIYITLDDPDALSPYLAIAVNGEVSVDWGDGSTPSTMTGSSISTLVRCQHMYNNIGNYVISIEVVSGKFAFYGRGTNYASCLFKGDSSNNKDRSRLYSKAITKVNVGRNADISTSAFSGCYSLSSVTIPDSVTSIASSAFYNCTSLSSIIIPDGVTNIGVNTFYGCTSLSSVTIPDSVTGIESGVFQNCYSLLSITIPDSVTSIGSTAFSSCYGMSDYHFKSTTPPTLASTNVFNNIVSDTIIYVPYSADHSILEAYKTATNWSTHASKMQEEPAP